MFKLFVVGEIIGLIGVIVALGFGLSAVYQVWPTGLFIGVLLKLLGSGFMLLPFMSLKFLGLVLLADGLNYRFNDSGCCAKRKSGFAHLRFAAGSCCRSAGA